MARLSEMLMSKSQNSVDTGYIKTLLFPELYNADIPQPMSTQSYCRFTDKKELTFKSGQNGMLIWYPKVNYGPSIFIRSSAAAIDTPVSFALSSAGWKAAGF